MTAPLYHVFMVLLVSITYAMWRHFTGAIMDKFVVKNDAQEIKQFICQLEIFSAV